MPEVWGLDFGVQDSDLGIRFWGSGFRALGLQGEGGADICLETHGLGFMVEKPTR